MTTLKFTDEERAALSENSQILVAMWEAEGPGRPGGSRPSVLETRSPRAHAYGDKKFISGWRRHDPGNEYEHPLGR